MTVEKEKSLCEEKKYHSRISISFFSKPVSLSSQQRVFWRDYLSLVSDPCRRVKMAQQSEQQLRSVIFLRKFEY